MIWQLVEKLLSYCFILAVFYVCSQTVLQWNDTTRISQIKDELRKQFESDRQDLQRQINRLDVNQSNYNISQQQRLDAIQQSLDSEKKFALLNKNNK